MMKERQIAQRIALGFAKEKIVNRSLILFEKVNKEKKMSITRRRIVADDKKLLASEYRSIRKATQNSHVILAHKLVVMAKKLIGKDCCGQTKTAASHKGDVVITFKSQKTMERAMETLDDHFNGKPPSYSMDKGWYGKEVRFFGKNPKLKEGLKVLDKSGIKFDKQIIASIKMAKDLIDMDEDDAIEAVLDKLVKRVDASYWEFVRKNEYVMYWDLDDELDEIQAEFIVNPSNQPKEEGIIKISLYIINDRTGMTLEDGVWAFEAGDSIQDAVRALEKPIKNVLRNR